MDCSTLRPGDQVYVNFAQADDPNIPATFLGCVKDLYSRDEQEYLLPHWKYVVEIDPRDRGLWRYAHDGDGLISKDTDRRVLWATAEDIVAPVSTVHLRQNLPLQDII